MQLRVINLLAMPNTSTLDGSVSPTLANPFDAQLGALRRLQGQIGSGCLSAASALTELNRTLRDIVGAAATAFLLSPLPAPSASLASLTHSAQSLQQSTESFIRRLRAACILSVDDSRQVDRMAALLSRATESAAYEMKQERVMELSTWLLDWLQRLSESWKVQATSVTSGTSVSSPYARTWSSSASLPVISTTAAHIKPVSSWTDDEWRQRCQPLWNTTQLSLAQSEEEDTEKEKAAEEERRDIIAQVKQRQKDKREADKQKQTERQERQQLKAERAADRAKRLEEGEIDADEAKKEEEEENAREAEEEEGDKEEEEKEEALHIPPPVVRHVPLTFCCISCHSALLTPANIQRVYSNTIWSTRNPKVDALFKNMADVWEQEEEEADMGRNSAEDDEAEAEAQGDEQSDESDAQKRRRSTTTAVHCARCFAYVGRWFVKEEQFRLVYIDRLTGRNWLFVTGDEATVQNKLTPLLTPKKEGSEDEEAEQEEEEEDEDGEKKPRPIKQEVITAIVGLPVSYESAAQARQYPFPRFPVLAIAQTPADVNDNFPPLPPAIVSSLMASSADPLYSLSTSSDSAMSLLLRCDPALHARVLLLLVTRNVGRVFSSFASSAYASPASCPVPAFTHFYLTPPQFNHARGTARYAFHYLTQRDDSKVKRQQWSVKRVREAQRKAGELSALFIIAGGWGGMRAVVIKVGGAYRVLQSNELCREKADRYSLTQWLSGNSRWSRLLDEAEWSEWLGKYERARRGERAVWEELFCRGASVELLGCSQPQDSFKDSDCQFSISKLVLDHMTVE